MVDSSGPRSTVQHFSRLKRAMKEFDTAWHDSNANMVVRFSLELHNFFLYTDAGFPFFTYRYILIVPEFRVKHAVLSAKLS